ncbi:MAG TPA: hypothetical protein VGX28_01380 [Frankiaceae bacterium]|jgi:hypothetical protein|nr:hypothetical protein [Frankiaceae bacterium]
MVRKLVLLAVAVTLAAPPVANAVVLVKPCHGDTYRYGALVYDPQTGTYRRMCIEQ